MRLETTSMIDWWKRELVIRDDGLEWELWKFRQRIKMNLPYERIARVQLLWGRNGDDMQVVGRSSSDDLLVRGVDRRGAARVKAVIEQRIGCGRV